MPSPPRWVTPLLLMLVLLGAASPAAADITAFLGVNTTPTNRAIKGFAVGTGLLIVGFEFEYANANEDLIEGHPRLRTFMFNGLVQTPVPIARMQFYGTAGGGVYRETLNDDRRRTSGSTWAAGPRFPSSDRCGCASTTGSRR